MQVLLVGDSDVGKQEILGGLEDGAVEAPYASSTGAGECYVLGLFEPATVYLIHVACQMPSLRL